MGKFSRKISKKPKRKYEKTYRSTNKRLKDFRKKHGRSRKRNMKILGGEPPLQAVPAKVAPEEVIPQGWQKKKKREWNPVL